MKLLLEQDLSHKLVGMLADLFPGSAHVRDLAGQNAVASILVLMVPAPP